MNDPTVVEITPRKAWFGWCNMDLGYYDWVHHKIHIAKDLDAHPRLRAFVLNHELHHAKCRRVIVGFLMFLFGGVPFIISAFLIGPPAVKHPLFAVGLFLWLGLAWFWRYWREYAANAYAFKSTGLSRETVHAATRRWRHARDGAFRLPIWQRIQHYLM